MTAELLSETPVDLRRRIVSGMRWTLWLSVLAVPFSYGTTVLLARAGTEVIGTYGLLMVYISVLSSLFYLGGDAVTIKFIPELDPGQRPAFLASYFAVICLSLIPWLAAATLWPQKLHYLFGKSGGASFQVFVLYLSPLYIAFSLVVAALKAVLEMRWAQTLMRVLTLGTFLIYAALYWGALRLLKAHDTGLIWGIYLGLTALACAIGFWRLVRLKDWQFDWHLLRFFLPRGFWKYTLSTQQLSALGFFLQRLDLILVLNLGSLNLLGMYVAILTLAGLIPTVNRFFLDTLLPSLTNLLASGNVGAASQVFSANLRILFAVDMAATCGLMFLVAPIIRLMGPEYASVRSLFILMVLLQGLAAPGAVGGTLLSSVGKQQRSVWVGLGQLALFGAFFVTLWPRWQLLGAVLASGLSTLASQILLLVVARCSTPVRFSAVKDYAWFVLVGMASGTVAMRLTPPGVATGLMASAGAFGLFLLLAGYTLSECRVLSKCFLPTRWSDVAA